jgi:hypothetical protein
MENKKTLVSLTILFFLFVSICVIPSAKPAGDDMNIVVGVLGAPKNFEVERYQKTSVKIRWEKGTNSDTTIIVRKTGNYPDSISDGTIIYNGTGTDFIDSSTQTGKHYYYRAWSYVNGFYSQNYGQGNIILGQKIYHRLPPMPEPPKPAAVTVEEFKKPLYFLTLAFLFFLLFFIWRREEEKEEKGKPEKEEKEEKKKDKKQEDKDKKEGWFFGLFSKEKEEAS